MIHFMVILYFGIGSMAVLVGWKSMGRADELAHKITSWFLLFEAATWWGLSGPRTEGGVSTCADFLSEEDIGSILWLSSTSE